MSTTAHRFGLLRRAWRVAAGVCTTARGSESLPRAFGLAAGCRVWWAPKVKPKAPPAGLAPGMGGRVVGWRCCLWSPSPGFPVASSPERKQTGLAESSRIAAAVVRPRPAGHRQPGQLGYARRRDGESGTQAPVCGEVLGCHTVLGSCCTGVRLLLYPARPLCSRWGLLPVPVCVPDPSSLSAVLAQSGRTGGVRPDGTAPQRRRFGLTPPGRSDSLRASTATRDPGLGDHTTTATHAGSSVPSEPRPAGGA